MNQIGKQKKEIFKMWQGVIIWKFKWVCILEKQKIWHVTSAQLFCSNWFMIVAAVALSRIVYISFVASGSSNFMECTGIPAKQLDGHCVSIIKSIINLCSFPFCKLQLRDRWNYLDFELFWNNISSGESTRNCRSTESRIKPQHSAVNNKKRENIML